MRKERDGTLLLSNGETLTCKAITQLREPICKDDREAIDTVLSFHKGMPMATSFYIAGADRSFDHNSGTYGNSFMDFTEWPSDKPMDAQQNAEYFLNMCFTDAVVRMNMNKVLTDDQAESIIWMARKGLLIAAAATVNYILNKKKGETTNGSGST